MTSAKSLGARSTVGECSSSLQVQSQGLQVPRREADGKERGGSLSSMTVMVTGASGVVGRATVKALLARDEVRATVRRAADASYLRQLGAKVAVRDIDSPDALSEILPRCHTVVHLVGGVAQPDPDALFHANHGSVLRALEAATQAGTKRFVLLSVPGADPQATHPFLRAKGLAEEAVRASGIQHAIVRSTHAYGLGGLWFTAAVEGALAEPSFVLGPDGAPPTHASGQAAAEVLTRILGVPIDAVTASFFALPSRADAPDAAEAFGVARTPLVEGLRVTLEAAAAIDTG